MTQDTPRVQGCRGAVRRSCVALGQRRLRTAAPCSPSRPHCPLDGRSWANCRQDCGRFAGSGLIARRIASSTCSLSSGTSSRGDGMSPLIFLARATSESHVVERQLAR